jgi:hypothetical protein
MVVLMTERERIRAILAFALRHKAAALRWKRHDDRTVEVAADQVLSHLELSNVRLTMGPPSGHHATPGHEDQA